MPRILHVIQALSTGGAARAMISAAKYSRQLDPTMQHRVMALSSVDPEAAALAEQVGMSVTLVQHAAGLLQEMEAADIVHVQWWNNPELQTLFRAALPPIRLIAWFHVGGDRTPQIISSEVVNFVDHAMACSPHTYRSPGIAALPEELRRRKASIVYGAADFERVEGVRCRPAIPGQSGFNVGYIGTVHYMKMHPRFVQMSSAVEVPDAKFIVCGAGDLERVKVDAEKTGSAERFDFRGYVPDIRSVIEELDCYGYPLCEDTYAASEVNLQEVMYAGLPVVVFPYGGIRYLVEHNRTGLVVNSECEYKEALEYLYYNPSERTRLGRAASEYAGRVFGAKNAARELNRVYAELLKQPKRCRSWGKDVELPIVEQPLDLCEVIPVGVLSPAELFVESLVDPAARAPFQISLYSEELTELFEAEERIANLSELFRVNGVLTYRNYFREDGYLRLWAGLGYWGQGDFARAALELFEALRLGNNHWRVCWYLCRAAAAAGSRELALTCLPQLLSSVPDFQPARELYDSLMTTQAVSRY